MRMHDDSDERGMGTPVTYTIVGVSVFVLILLAAVFMNNTGRRNTNSAGKAVQTSPAPTPEEEPEQAAEGETDIETLYKQNKLRSEDLDFWNMYDDEPVILATPTPKPTPTPSHEPTDEELAAGGEHVKVTLRDGTIKWVEISDQIPLYPYDFTNIRITAGKMEYYQDGEKSSCLGVEISKDSGNVDFAALKASGVDFVMIKIGSRGYETGLLTLDENFENNIKKAQDAGLEVGITFFSQAVSVDEAVEEAEFVAGNLTPYKINYPIAFDMEYIANDEARIDFLDADGKTQIAEAFLSSVEREGYRPILYGNKDWLLGELVPDKLLKDYDVWLNDQSPVPDYPYQFRLWKYAVKQKINGIENETAYIISFVDYTRK